MIEKKSLDKPASLIRATMESTPFLVFSFLLCVVGLISYTLFRREYLPGDDWLYHVARIEGVKDGILNGEFPVKVHGQFFNGYGYGNGLFYPSLFLYIPALLRILGIDMILSYKIFVFLIVAATTFSSYVCAQSILRNRFASLCATLLFASSHMVITNIYWRSALGEMLATIFLPIVIYGVYNLLYENFSKPWVIVLGFSGLVFSHLITLVFAVLFTFLAVLLHIRVFFRKEQIIDGRCRPGGITILRKLLLSAGLVLFLTCSFWIPMLEQMASDSFQYSQPYLKVSESALNLSEVFLFSKASLGLPIAAFSLIAICFRIFSLTRKPLRKILPYDVFLLVGVIFSLSATKIFPWEAFEQLLNPIQFPWRILTIASFFLALGIAGTCGQFFHTRASKILLLLILCVLCSAFCVSMINIRWDVFHTDKAVNVYLEDDATGVGKEWLPLSANPVLLNHSGFVLTDRESVISVNRQGTRISFPAEYNASTYDAPLIYYKGYSAFLEKADGSRIALLVQESDSGTVRVLTQDNAKGVITVSYTGTVLQKASYGLNAAAILLAGFFLLKSKKSHLSTSLSKSGPGV